MDAAIENGSLVGSSIAESSNSPTTEEELLHKHKLEKKELVATIQKLKKNVNNCKKRKKEVAEEIAKLEADLKVRQEQQLSELRSNGISNGIEEQVTEQVSELSLADNIQEAPSLYSNVQPAGKASRAAKRRAKKADAAALREAELERERDYQLLHSPRAVEARLMAGLVRQKKLLVQEVQPDGNCMYAALSHQLAGSRSMEQLRHVAADYLLQHQDDFMPFLSHPDTGEALDEEGFRDYCNAVANTPAWGGQPELRAISQSLKRRIEVLQAEGASMVVGEEFPGPPLLLAYYRHSFSLGEHYNSLYHPTPAGDDGAAREEHS